MNSTATKHICLHSLTSTTLDINNKHEVSIMGILGQVNFDNPSERDKFNSTMEKWMNRQAFWLLNDLFLNFHLFRRKDWSVMQKFVWGLQLFLPNFLIVLGIYSKLNIIGQPYPFGLKMSVLPFHISSKNILHHFVRAHNTTP